MSEDEDLLSGGVLYGKARANLNAINWQIHNEFSRNLNGSLPDLQYREALLRNKQLAEADLYWAERGEIPEKLPLLKERLYRRNRRLAEPLPVPDHPFFGPKTAGETLREQSEKALLQRKEAEMREEEMMHQRNKEDVRNAQAQDFLGEIFGNPRNMRRRVDDEEESQMTGQGYDIYFENNEKFPYDKDSYFSSSRRPDAQVLDAKNPLFGNVNDGPGDDSKLNFAQWWYMLRHGSKNRIEPQLPKDWAEKDVKETVLQFHNRYAFIDAVVYTPLNQDASFAHIFSYLVNPYVRGKGVGARIFKHFENYLYREYHVRRIFLEPLDRGEIWDPYGFWYKLGFRYPGGEDLKLLSPADRHGEPAFKRLMKPDWLQDKVNRRKEGVDIINERGKGPKIPTKQPSYRIGSDRVYTARHMWKDAVYKPTKEAHDNLESEILFTKKPDHHFSYDKNHPTKLKIATYDRTPHIDVLKAQLKAALIDIFYHGKDPDLDHQEDSALYTRDQESRKRTASLVHGAHKGLNRRAAHRPKPQRVETKSEFVQRHSGLAPEPLVQPAQKEAPRPRKRKPEVIDLTGPEVIDLTND